jgi:hypothetical protein
MTGAPLPGDLLTEGQRRHLVASLGRVERHLHELQALLGDRAAAAPELAEGAERELPAAARAAVRQPIADAMATLGALGSSFALTARRRSRFASMQAMVIASVVLIEDASSRHLAAYGPVDPRLPAVLDPMLDRLREQLMAVATALQTGTRGDIEGA